MNAIRFMEMGLLPDTLVRMGIQSRLKARLAKEQGRFDEASYITELKSSPIAVDTTAANDQHYELPAKFFHTVLGPRLKYSSCIWPDHVQNLAEAEEAMLALTAERAGIQDGMDLLELGCGWGSLSIWLAEHFPNARITSVSNSNGQRLFIEQRCKELGLKNLRVITCDMNEFKTDQQFDRVLSVEMFEHMRNYQELMRRISGWMKPDGRLFVHIFTHRDLAYLFETDGDRDWMARYFFTGGMMPSHELLSRFNEDLVMENDWKVNGQHYSKTLRAWLRLQDQHKAELMPLFKETYGKDALVWFERWRVFFMACEELFNYNHGKEWGVSHYLFRHA